MPGSSRLVNFKQRFDQNKTGSKSKFGKKKKKKGNFAAQIEKLKHTQMTFKQKTRKRGRSKHRKGVLSARSVGQEEGQNRKEKKGSITNTWRRTNGRKGS